MRKKKLLSESQIRRMAKIAGIPVIGLVSEKLDIQAEEAETTTEETTEETVEETTDVAEGGKYYEEDEDPTDAASMEAEEEPAAEEPAAEEPAAEEVPQEKIESLVDAVLAAIEQETGVPAQRVEDEAPDEEPEPEGDLPAEEPEMEVGEEEPIEEPEMMESSEPTLAERIAAAVQTVLDEDAALEEGSCTTNEEEEVTEKAKEEQLEEITKAVVARLRSMNK